MNILIVDALAANDGKRKFTRDVIGVGPRLLAGVAEKNKVNVKIIRAEELIRPSSLGEEDIASSLANFDVFLVSAMTVDYIAVKEVIGEIHNQAKDSIIGLGGPILSDFNVVTQFKINFAVYGEGEYIVDQLIKNGFDIKSLDNVSIPFPFTKETIKDVPIFYHTTPLTEQIFNDFSPSTQRIRDYRSYWFSRVYVEVLRGCSNFIRGTLVREKQHCSNCGICDTPSKIKTGRCPDNIAPGCGFCSVPSTFGPPRNREVDQIVKEVEELFDMGVKRIMLSAPGFLDYYRREQGKKTTFSPTYPAPNINKIAELLSKLNELKNKEENRVISVENIKPSLVNKEVVKLFKKYLSDTPISIGCETFDLELSKKIGRPSNPSEAIKASKLLYKAGLKTQIYLIHSLPGETVQSLDITTRTVTNDLDGVAEKITVYKYLPLPNSPFTRANLFSPLERHLLNKKREELKKAIISFNRKRKEEMIGLKLKVIVAEKDKHRNDTYISYILNGGPAVSIYSKSNLLSKIALVEIEKVLSDKLLKAKVVKILT